MEALTQTNPSQGLALSKHHGLGNDFLIALDPTASPGPAEAIQWCDRRSGFGADGLIVATPLDGIDADWRMVLYNSDGSRAEISGNGIRCLGQALAMRDGASTVDYRILTDAGVKLIEVGPAEGLTRHVRVDMGPAVDGPGDFDRWDEVGMTPRGQSSLDMGNPHLVVLIGDAASVDLAAVGPSVESDYPRGINIEFISEVDRSRIALRVWERGAGITRACGSGACAAAVAATRWGLVDSRVEVEMEGGTALVEVTDTVHLTGPTTLVGGLSVPADNAEGVSHG